MNDLDDLKTSFSRDLDQISKVHQDQTAAELDDLRRKAVSALSVDFDLQIADPDRPCQEVNLSQTPSVSSQLITSQPERIDFLLVTALPEEQNALLTRLPGHRQTPPTAEDTHTYTKADIPVQFADGSNAVYHIVNLTLAGIGRVQAGVAATGAIQRWKPSYVFLIGIAGGFANRHVAIGDVLVADQIVEYEMETLLPDKPEMRWQVFRSDPRLLEASKNLSDELWRKSVMVRRPVPGVPRSHTGPIATGDKVFAFDEVIGKLQEHWPMLLGVEMEAGGLAAAAYQAPEKPGFFMVRGVADLADQNRYTEEVKQWRGYACDVAIAYALALIKSARVPVVNSGGQATPAIDW